MERMRTSVTGSRARGFSLLELLIVLTIAGLAMALVVPSGARMLDAMQSRQAVRDALALLAAARQRAVSSGRAQDVFVQPAQRRVWTGEREQRLPGDLTLTVHGAAELNREDTGVIRFYPDGGASGGGIDILRADGSGTRISVDWRLGRVTQQRLGGG